MSDPSGDLRSRRTLPTSHIASKRMHSLSPTRSRTDPPAPEPHRHERQGLHKRLHSNSVRARGIISSQAQTYRQHAKDTVQSAIELKPPINFDHILRRDKKSASTGLKGHGSNQAQNQQQQGDTESNDAEAQRLKEREEQKQRVQPRHVVKAKQDNARREDELRESLQLVEATAMDSTRELDKAYYAILEKAAALRSTVSSLQQLAQASQRLHATFRDETTNLEKAIKGNMDSFTNFNTQEETITELVDKLKNSKVKKDRLSARLEESRRRVETFELREQEKAKVRRRRWRLIWISLTAFLVLVVAALIAKNRSRVGSRIERTARMIDHMGKDVVSPVSNLLAPNSTKKEDPHLQELFDTL